MSYIPTSPVQGICPTVQPPRQIMATGFGRGGTTCLREILSGLGVDMQEGVRADPEDYRTDTMGHPDERRRVLMRRSLTADGPWGWKDIFLLDYIDEIPDLLTNPALLIIWRDPFTTASRALIEERKVTTSSRSLTEIMQDITNRGQQALRFVSLQSALPTAFVSYEKLCAYPKQAVEQIAEFLRLPFDQAALDTIKCHRLHWDSPENEYTEDS